MTPNFNKLLLTSHISFSVGWFGAVAVFLVFAINGVTNTDAQLASSAYFAMELTGWYIIVPFCLASLLTGILQTLATRWGLFKHYWIVVKLILTIAATVLLLLHMKPIGFLAGIAKETGFNGSEEISLRIQLIADSVAALFLLLATITISVYKPWGKIKTGLENNPQSNNQKNIFAGFKKRKFYFLLGTIILILLIIILKHLKNGGMGHQ